MMEIQSEEGKAIDRTPLPRKLYYTFREDIINLSVTSVKFMIGHKLAKNIFSVYFQIKGRNIYDDENLTFDLDILNPEN